VHQDPEDVVQQAICDALAVEAVPAEREEIPKWFFSIVHRRVVDRFRRQWRAQAVELSEVPCHIDPEGRDLLQRLDRDLTDDARRRTLGWLLREHAGESLKDIADELALDAAALRQRICRLRRELRAKYLAALSVLLLFWVGADAYWPVSRDPTAVSQVATSVYDGDYVLVDATKNDVNALGLRINVRAGTARVSDRTGVLRGTLQVNATGADTLTLRSGPSYWDVTVIQLDGTRLQLRGNRGFITLQRSSALRATP
jgi:DNA-directed RNA polymerase specialized sigma24 family protein